MKCYVEGCDHPPVASYTWPWGETGLVCALHHVNLRQMEKNLKRQVTITPLQPGEPTPITRDERIASKARTLALEEECEELRKRGMELYRQHEALKEQLRVALANTAAVDAELRHAVHERDQLRELLGEAERAAARENDELQQLRALVPS